MFRNGWEPDPEAPKEIPKPAPRFSPKIIAAIKGKPLPEYVRDRTFDDERPVSVAKPKREPRAKREPKPKNEPKQKPIMNTVLEAPVKIEGEHRESDIKIYVSYNYNNFRNIVGNRGLNQAKIKRINKDIDEGLNLLPHCPIVVVEHEGLLDIVDGQHRFAVAKSRKSPVWYVIRDEMSLLKIAKINSNMENWKDKDYINCYSVQGNRNYVQLQEFMDTYKLPVTTALVLLSRGTMGSDSSGQKEKQAFLEGRFVVNDWNTASATMQHVLLFEGFSGLRTRGFIAAVCKIVEGGKVKIQDVAEKFQKYPEELKAQANWKDYLINLEAIYNKGKHSREVIY